VYSIGLLYPNVFTHNCYRSQAQFASPSNKCYGQFLRRNWHPRTPHSQNLESVMCVILHVTRISVCEATNSPLQETRGSLLRTDKRRYSKMMLIPNTSVYAHLVCIAA
jgi:hypothetical protein